MLYVFKPSHAGEAAILFSFQFAFICSNIKLKCIVAQIIFVA